ncbi:TPA: hypothetical protein JBB06_12580 [Legionella pneumophila subsp. pneumophila]|uniref:Uncharacterized protein n=1 Tax=Legionella pneumophila (strain Lens) TaxID=297245 RepID=Q5WUW1_LEGPL|nr:hypothetical protein [Legionella pneumophila]AOW51412.1 hypothetical protein BE841_02515 [Legionella pneumophila subsp. pneumophila]AOW54989.1 hypothetical protein BE842_06240 [Legionella pneumophila subsp. pneumophila]AOW64919.1 hypothetical protein BE845_12975 [Legionella pneumophila subsp. pneumophila]RYW81454.1 hypothetical protein D7216_13785 [Legionella pneumophila]RYW86738.1 hypothetical protein D7221_10985 [Legionella pneumophila]
MAYTLTLLGTDTAFTPNPDNGYEKGETLSYVSTLVNRQGAEEQSDDSITKYRNLKIAVVDGPDTMGKEVGDRIARGVASILEAISRGETKISIMAHSRGAVEAILVAHELERIQENFKRDKNSPDLRNSECGLTKTAMEAQKDTYESLNLEGIAKNINNVELSIFNIDPVPGGDFLGAPVGWKDDRFFRVPKIVKEYEQCVYENERTRCFKAIVPKCDSSDTKFNLFSLPGHHGTGSGNLKDQQQHPVDMEGKTTEHAQQLMIIKLIDFLTRNEVAIKPGQDRTQEQLDNDPLYKLIQPLIDEEGKSKKEELKAIYLTLYQEIINNKAAYERFNKTSYPVLGQEQSIQRVFGSYRDDRIILHQAYKDAFLSDVLPHLPGGHFVNYDHARLTINQELGLKDGLPLNEVIDKTVDRLGEIMKHSSKLNMLKKGDGEANDLSQSVLDDNCAHAIQSETGFNILVDSLEGVIGEVGNIYCHDKHKSMGEEEREALFHSVKRAIDSFKNDELEDNELAKTVREKINTTVKSILTDKINRLNQDADILSKKQGHNLSEVINTAFTDLLKSPSLNDYEYEDKLNEFRDFNNHIISLLKLKPPQIKESKALLEEKLKSLEKADPPDILDKDMTNFFGELLDFIPDYDVNQLMEDATQLYDELESFKESFTHFKELNDSLDYAQWQSDLEGKQRQLIDQTARYIQKNNLNLEKDIDPLFPDNNSPLYEQIKLVASNYGLENPDFVKLKRQNSELSCKIDEQVEKIKEFQQIKERHDADKIKLEELNQELQVLQVSDSAKEREVEEIRHQIVSLKADIQSQTRQKVDLEKQIKNLNSEITWLSTDKQQLTIEREIQDKRINDLTELVNRLNTHEEKECNAVVSTLEKLTIDHLNYLKLTAKKGNTQNDTIKEQIEITENLQGILCNTKQYPLPSERITAFTNQLNKDNEKLSAQHDPDPAWKRFAKSCLITIGVICSGIIPGILALAAYNHFKDKSSPQSFTNKYKNELNKIKQQSDISKHQTEDETQSLTTTGLAR